MSVADKIKQKLERAFTPKELTIINESHLHAGHSGDNGSGESHFRVVVVSQKFEGLSRIECQRLVFEVLAEEISGPIHALTLKCIAPQDFSKINTP